MTVRILHTADLHLDSPLASLALVDAELRARVATASRQALERIVALAVEHEVAALLIAGDLFDRAERSVQTAAFFARQMRVLGDRGIAVFAIKGNHDAENPIAGDLALPGNVHVFGARAGKRALGESGVWIHGISFAERRAPQSLVPRFEPPEPGAVNIALLHTSLSGASGHDAYAPCSLAELSAAGMDYWALGHVHSRQVHARAPWVVMPGMPQGRDIGEAGPKSATLIEIGPGGIAVRELATSVVEFRRTELDLTGVDDDRALSSAIETHLEAALEVTRSEVAVLRPRLTGRTASAAKIRRDADYLRSVFEEAARGSDRLWIEGLEIAVEAPAPAPGGRQDPVAELERLMREIAGEEGFRAAAKAELDQVLQALPRERRDAFASGGAAGEGLSELADGAARRMAARMRSAVPRASDAAEETP